MQKERKLKHADTPQNKYIKKKQGVTLSALIITFAVLFIFVMQGQQQAVANPKETYTITTKDGYVATVETDGNDITLKEVLTPSEAKARANTPNPSLITGNITVSAPTWTTNENATVTLSTTTGLKMQWQKNSISGIWVTGNIVEGLKHGDTIFTRLIDEEGNAADEASVSILDSIAPELATITNLPTSTTTNTTITANVTHTDNQSKIDITKCKWLFNTKSTNLNVNSTDWNTAPTFSNSTNQISITVPSEPGSYYLHVLSVDIVGNKKEKISSKVEVKEPIVEQWEYLGRVAKHIATRTDITINEDTQSVSGRTAEGDDYNISVGATYKVRYNNEKTLRTVRVLGFKHDDLADTAAYGIGTNVTKAGISFEFVDFLMTSGKGMNTTNTNENGWAATQMRKDLNGYTTDTPNQTGTIGGEAANLSNKNQIKKVKKAYMPDRKEANLSTTPAEDYLWLLSCGEIWNDGDTNNAGVNARGYARNSEGSQYKYYKNKSGLKYNVGNDEIKKPNSASAYHWWLRSPYYNGDTHFCGVTSNGYCNNGGASNGNSVAPGFSI